MDALAGLVTGFGVILTPENLYLCFLGSLIGTLVGVLPGVGPLAALALLLPITFTLTPGRRHGDALFDLLRRNVWRLDNLDPAEHPGRSRVRRDLH